MITKINNFLKTLKRILESSPKYLKRGKGLSQIGKTKLVAVTGKSFL